MNEQQVESVSESHTRIAAAQVRLSRLSTVETRLRKLNAALANLAVAERPRQLGLIRAARQYVEDIGQEPVQGVKNSLKIISNELQSFDEGLRARAVSMSDLTLISAVRAVKHVEELKTGCQLVITRLQSRIDASGESDPSIQEIEKSRDAIQSVPDFGDKTYLLHRLPVAFSGKNFSDKKFSRIGYVNTDLLDRQGFSAGSIGGYAVIRKQLCIGVNPLSLFKDGPVDDLGQSTRLRRTIKDIKHVNKGGKPTRVEVRRERTQLDEAREILKLVEQKTGTIYAFVSTIGANFKRGTWFWIMPAIDIRRFAKAFPGGHIDVQKWGIAGDQTVGEALHHPVHVPPNRMPSQDIFKR
jgi:hypothetical protein